MEYLKKYQTEFYLISSAFLVIFIRFHEYGINFDSALYATVARNFSEDLNWFNLHFSPFYFSHFAEHPPLSIWIQGLIFKLLGANDSTARLLNSFCGVGIVFLTYLLGKRVLNQMCGLVAASMVLLTQSFQYDTTTMLLDIPLAFWSLLAIYFSFKIIQDSSKPWSLGLWIVVGSCCAVLTKGVFAVVPIFALGFFSLCFVSEWRAKVAILLALVMGIGLSFSYFIMQHFLGDFSFAEVYIRNQISHDAQKAISGTFNFRLIPLYFQIFLPWSILFPVGLVATVRYAKNLRFRWFAILLTVATFAFFMMTSRAYSRYLHVFYPISALSIAALVIPLRDKFQSLNVLMISRCLLAISILIAFLSQVYPYRMRLSSVPDYFVLSETIKRLRTFEIDHIFAWEQGFSPWVLRERGQWYWYLPLHTATDMTVYQNYTQNEKSHTALLIKTSELPSFQTMFPKIFDGLTVYAQTNVFSFFIPRNLVSLYPEVSHAPLWIPENIH